MFWRFFFKKTIRLLLSLLLFSIFLYGLLYWSTGDPALGVLRRLGVQAISQEMLQKTREQLGLDGGILPQYLRWLNKVLHGNFGNSFMSNQPVMETILLKLPPTCKIISFSFLITVPLSLFGGLFIGNLHLVKVSGGLQGLLTVFLSLPIYWAAIVLIFVFGVKFKWVPFVGSSTPQHFILPVMVNCLIEGSYLTKMISDLVKQIKTHERFVLANFRGIKRRYILFYQIKALFTPLATLYANCLTYFLGSTVMIEIIFSISGLGKLLIEAITARDYPMIQGISLIMACLTFILNYFVDLLIQLADPRILIDKRQRT